MLTVQNYRQHSIFFYWHHKCYNPYIEEPSCPLRYSSVDDLDANPNDLQSISTIRILNVYTEPDPDPDLNIDHLKHVKTKKNMLHKIIGKNLL